MEKVCLELNEIVYLKRWGSKAIYLGDEGERGIFKPLCSEKVREWKHKDRVIKLSENDIKTTMKLFNLETEQDLREMILNTS